jgi:hypothetical protein
VNPPQPAVSTACGTNKHTHMKFNPYDDVVQINSTNSSVALQSLTGSSAVKGTGIDTQVANPLEAILIHIRAEIASGTPDAATVAWKLQESVDDVDGDYGDAKDNAGNTIGATLDVHTAAKDAFARVEGLGLYNGATAAPFGGRKRWLRIVLTPTFTNGSSPAILCHAQYIGVPASGQQLPVRTTVSNT